MVFHDGAEARDLVEERYSRCDYALVSSSEIWAPLPLLAESSPLRHKWTLALKMFAEARGLQPI